MNVVSRIDHAILRPEITDEMLKQEIEKIRNLPLASVCVKPYHVKLAKELLKNTFIKVGTVIGFPHGSNLIDVKADETLDAMLDGADKIDFVVNIGKLLSNDFTYIKNEIEKISGLVNGYSGGIISKVIIESGLLTKELIEKVCQIALQTDVDFIKTSTGFNGAGANLEDIEIIKSIVGNNKKIKASGGIKNREQTQDFIDAGCERIGTSATIEILNGEISKNNY